MEATPIAEAQPAAGAEGLSKSEQKRRAKQEQVAAAKAAKEAARAAEKAAKAAQPQTAKDTDVPVLEEEDDNIDPTKYFENRLAWVDGIKEKSKNPYPHKFQTSFQFPEYIAKYEGLAAGAPPLSETVHLAGRVMNKRSGGKGLVFYDLHGDGCKLQVRQSAASPRAVSVSRRDTLATGRLARCRARPRPSWRDVWWCAD